VTEKKAPTGQEKVSEPKRPGRPASEAPVGDVTRTARAARHRERLVEAKGKRFVVDAPAPVVEALVGLLAQGYGLTQKEVFCKAVLEIAARPLKKS
jgi:hypothetical protein